MIVSMTGYGKAVITLPYKKVTIEIRSLNSKTLDLSLRVPNFYREKELEIRNIVSENVQRGKVDLSMLVELNPLMRVQQLNTELIKAYIADFKKITPNISDQDLLPVVMRMPDVMGGAIDELDQEEWESIKTTFLEAIEAMNKFRRDEGSVLKSELDFRINNILSLLYKVEPFEKERIEKIKERFEKKLGEFNFEVDQNRYEQEMIFFLEKLDITEEKVRLRNHCEYFQLELEEQQSNGKKLGFIAQEIGREINTLGSKSNHSEMQKIVIQMKDELEKMKEQLLNVL